MMIARISTRRPASRAFGVSIAALLALAVPAAAQQVTPAQNVSGYLAVYQAFPNTPLTGTTSETNIAAIRIPAGSMGPFGVVRVSALFSCTNNANNKTVTFRFTQASGAVAGGFIAAPVVTTVTAISLQTTIRAAGVTNSQQVYPSINAPFGSVSTANDVIAVDTTADSFVNINGTLAVGTDTLTLLGYTVEVMHP
jgi:hypothetical protein